MRVVRSRIIPEVERGWFFYSADGGLLAKPEDASVRPALRNEWAEAALAMNPALDNPHIARFVPGHLQALLLPPDER
jgi:hypothetical protein